MKKTNELKSIFIISAVIAKSMHSTRNHFDFEVTSSNIL
jgi:hypothetical protein